MAACGKFDGPEWVGYGPSLRGDERLLRRDSGHCASAGQQVVTATTRPSSPLLNSLNSGRTILSLIRASHGNAHASGLPRRDAAGAPAPPARSAKTARSNAPPRGLAVRPVASTRNNLLRGCRAGSYFLSLLVERLTFHERQRTRMCGDAIGAGGPRRPVGHHQFKRHWVFHERRCN